MTDNPDILRDTRPSPEKNIFSRLEGDILSVLISEEQLRERVIELGANISRDYAEKNPVFVGVLKGSFVFMADLIRAVFVHCELGFMALSSYGASATSSGAVKINYDLSTNIENRHVILVEDILDSGLTLNYLSGYLRGKNPASIKIATLLNKPARRKAPVQADYSGFDIPDSFVVGYGLDYAEKYRNLPYIGILKPEIYI